MSVSIKSDKSECGFELTDMVMLDPHVLLSFLFSEAGLAIDDEHVQRFWQHHREFESPFLQAYDGSDHHIPVGLYGDGAQARQQAYQDAEKIVGIFLNLPLWRPPAGRSARWLLFCVEENVCYGRKTLNAIYRRIVWSLNHLFSGLWPTRGPDGELLTNKEAGLPITPGGKKFALVEHRGDWSFFKWILGFRSSWKGGTTVPVCYRCSAWGSGPCDRQYYHVGENAHAWSTEYDRAQFILAEMPPQDPCGSVCSNVLVSGSFLASE